MQSISLSLLVTQASLHSVTNRSIAYTFRELEPGKGSAVDSASPAANPGRDADAAAASASATAFATAGHAASRGPEPLPAAVALDRAASGSGRLSPDGTAGEDPRGPGVSPRSDRRRSLSMWDPDPPPEAATDSAQPGPSGQGSDQGLPSRSAALQALHGAGLLRKASRPQRACAHVLHHSSLCASRSLCSLSLQTSPCGKLSNLVHLLRDLLPLV